jgi:hypothetical protein
MFPANVKVQMAFKASHIQTTCGAGMKKLLLHCGATAHNSKYLANILHAFHTKPVKVIWALLFM